MSSKIFLVEINFDNPFCDTKATFNAAQARAFLTELRDCYDEVLIMSNQLHLLLIVAGQSASSVLYLLNDLMDGTSEIFTSSSQNAISVLMNVAKGDHWPDVSVHEIRTMITTAVRLSMEADCFGETLRGVVEAALFANAKRCKGQEYRQHDSILRSSAITQPDFSRISQN